MTPERAQEIVSAINDRCYFTIGIRDAVGTLHDVSLADMIAAKTIIEAENAKAAAGGGKYSIKMVPDDRLIAAAYCMEHYPASRDAIVILPASREEAFEHETTRKALAIVPISDDASEDSDD